MRESRGPSALGTAGEHVGPRPPLGASECGNGGTDPRVCLLLILGECSIWLIVSFFMVL